MNKVHIYLQKLLKDTNWDGIRCVVKAYPSMRDIKDALKMQKEIDERR